MVFISGFLECNIKKILLKKLLHISNVHITLYCLGLVDQIDVLSVKERVNTLADEKLKICQGVVSFRMN